MIERSARALGRGFYTEEETEAALAHIFGVDSQLIADGTYFVVLEDEEPVGAGGWSKRRTLFGGDQYQNRVDEMLDPGCDRAKIRAFFVHPSAARSGIGRLLLQHCEDEARRAGFCGAELMSTLPGVPFYAACGYRIEEEVTSPAGATELRFVRMRKDFEE